LFYFSVFAHGCPQIAIPLHMPPTWLGLYLWTTTSNFFIEIWVLFTFCVCDTLVWNQGFMFARQALLLLEPFHQTLVKFSLGLSLNHDPPDLCLPSNWYYWYKSQCSALEGVSFFFFVVLGLELRTYTLSYSTSPFSWRVFSTWGLVELFAWADFELLSSWSLPPE
jgi:hypothetical protein